jgi:hypothetical protein
MLITPYAHSELESGLLVGGCLHAQETICFLCVVAAYGEAQAQSNTTVFFP